MELASRSHRLGADSVPAPAPLARRPGLAGRKMPCLVGQVRRLSRGHRGGGRFSNGSRSGRRNGEQSGRGAATASPNRVLKIRFDQPSGHLARPWGLCVFLAQQGSSALRSGSEGVREEAKTETGTSLRASPRFRLDRVGLVVFSQDNSQAFSRQLNPPAASRWWLSFLNWDRVDGRGQSRRWHARHRLWPGRRSPGRCRRWPIWGRAGSPRCSRLWHSLTGPSSCKIGPASHRPEHLSGRAGSPR